ncbi:type VI secretion system baseplate subunit TssK [Ectopseudomonas khazarica]|uniref:type VI secretion system baseplate subunit TssK n=1 Tax=Ectopseudomonas khazarica TaxID=2502979 RepID=UPI0006471E99|nr:type VI secretion system baseplate subunit TssK [Pseudomonas khazarica]QTS86150.1 type VI secretion system baseplate subunit TssK [Pseudomonas khazarica]
MNPFQRVVWAEGMFLRPQHFQQQERYLEFYSHSRGMACEPYFWGVRVLKFDLAALAVGKLALTEAAGLLPDGTPFAFPLQSLCPEPLDFPEGVVEQVVYLALPLRRQGTEEVLFEERPRSLARYLVNDALVADVNSVAGEDAELQLGEPRLRLMLERDMTDAWLGVGVARVIERRGDRQVVLDRSYIPAMVSCHADTGVLSMLNEAHGLVSQRADALAQRLMQPGRGGVSEVSEFLLLQLLNRVEPVLAHMRAVPGTHPERFYLLLAQLASELATFMERSRRPADWPVYDHDNLQLCLPPLMMAIRSALSSVLEQNAVQIELLERSHGVRVGQIADGALLKNAQFVLAVHSSLSADTLRANFKTQVKIGPADRIRDLVNLHLPGIALQALPIAPRQIPYNAGYHYFEIDTGSDLWSQLQASRALALHIAGDFPDLQLECWAIRR